MATYDNTTGVLTLNSAVTTSATAKSFTYPRVDAAGNEGPESPARNFTVVADAIAPTAPAITNVVDNAGSVTGDIAKGATSDDNTPTVSGTGVPASTR